MFKKDIIIVLVLRLIWSCLANETVVSSCDGANARYGTNEAIRDDKENVWRINDEAKILKNDQIDNLTCNVTRLVYWNKTVYHQNKNGEIWEMSNSTWIKINSSELLSTLNNTRYCIDNSCSGSKNFTTTPFLNNFTQILTLCTTHEVFFMDQCSKTTVPPTVSSTDSSSSQISNVTSNEIKMNSTNQMIIPTTNVSCFDQSCRPRDQCNLTFTLCKNNRPCYVNHSSARGYECDCGLNFTGINCETYLGACQPDSCFYDGKCFEINDTFRCICTPGRTGDRCQETINYCDPNRCKNKGLCRSLTLQHKCECLYGTSGESCEHVSTDLVARRIVSRGFAYIAITVMCLTVGFFIGLDALKYGFGIDVVDRERRRMNHHRSLHRAQKRSKTSV